MPEINFHTRRCEPVAEYASGTFDAPNAFTRHAESLIRLENGLLQQDLLRPIIWPRTYETLDDYLRNETILVRLDGAVAGRVILETATHPFAELVNLAVSGAYRRHGVGSALVAECCRRAASLGFLAIHLQVRRDNRAAQNLYAAQGFLPAQYGEMLRMIRFLNLPALDRFLRDHPLYAFASRSVGERWEFAWTDHLTNDRVVFGLTGGSCQADSDGCGPGIASCDLRTDLFEFTGTISTPDRVRRGESFGVRLELGVCADQPVDVTSRLMLNAGCDQGSGTLGVKTVVLRPGETGEVELTAIVTESYDATIVKRVSSYPSLAVGVEAVVAGWCFPLIAQVRVEL